MVEQPLYPHDFSRFDPDRPDEMAFWSRSLCATPNQLRQAIKTMGPNVRDVQQYLVKARITREPDSSG